MNRQPDIATERTIDRFDATLGNLSGLPGGVETKPSTIQVLVPITGEAETHIIQTIYHEIGKRKPKGKDEPEEPIFGYTQFVQIATAKGLVRVVIPPSASDKLAAQREAISAKLRKRSAQKALQTRRDRGDVLGNPEALKAARKARKGGKR